MCRCRQRYRATNNISVFFHFLSWLVCTTFHWSSRIAHTFHQIKNFFKKKKKIHSSSRNNQVNKSIAFWLCSTKWVLFNCHYNILCGKNFSIPVLFFSFLRISFSCSLFLYFHFYSFNFFFHLFSVAFDKQEKWNPFAWLSCCCPVRLLHLKNILESTVLIYVQSSFALMDTDSIWKSSSFASSPPSSSLSLSFSFCSCWKYNNIISAQKDSDTEFWRKTVKIFLSRTLCASERTNERALLLLIFWFVLFGYTFNSVRVRAFGVGLYITPAIPIMAI